jgi:hypothetical protein
MVKQPGLFSLNFGATSFARFHVAAAELRGRTRDSQFGLLEPVIWVTTTAV